MSSNMFIYNEKIAQQITTDGINIVNKMTNYYKKIELCKKILSTSFHGVPPLKDEYKKYYTYLNDLSLWRNFNGNITSSDLKLMNSLWKNFYSKKNNFKIFVEYYNTTETKPHIKKTIDGITELKLFLMIKNKR